MNTLCKLIAIVAFLMMAPNGNCQVDEARKRFEDFKRQAHETYDNFRDEANKRYAEFKEESWKRFQVVPAVPKPKEKQVPPLTFPEEDRDKPIESDPIEIDEIITPPKPEPQPNPVTPIPEQVDPEKNYVKFVYFGTACKARFNNDVSLKLTDCSRDDLCEAWTKLSSTDYNNTIRDCLALREKLQLSDWAYLNMLNTFSEQCLGKGTSAVFMTAYLYSQSGYKMRLGRKGSDLCLLFSSKHHCYYMNGYRVGNDIYYIFNHDFDSIEIYDLSFPGERSMSFYITKDQLFEYDPTPMRTLTSERHPETTVNLSVNKNRIDFFDKYPESYINDDFMTRWAVFAQTPLDSNVKQELYPVLEGYILGLNQVAAANVLIDWVQNAFVYKYDEEVWGHDRPFFAEESLYYPYCDCEDRAILFSRLVRDLLGLKTLLVFYPGHLATAVCFTVPVNGDYITLNGERYVVCDPTYFGVPVGVTMPDMDNQSAKVILLE